MITAHQLNEVLVELTHSAKTNLQRFPEKGIPTTFFLLKENKEGIAVAVLPPSMIGYSKGSFSSLLQYLADHKTIDGYVLVSEAFMVKVPSRDRPQGSVRDHPDRVELLLGLASASVTDQAIVFQINRNFVGEVVDFGDYQIDDIGRLAGFFNVQWSGRLRRPSGDGADDSPTFELF